MSKRQYTIRGFGGGIVTTQPPSDLENDQYPFGYDIDPSYPGGIRGRSADNSFKTGIGANGLVSTRAELNANYQALISDKKVYIYQDGDITGVSFDLVGESVSLGSNVSMEVNNKTIHIGTGGGQDTIPKWLGIVNHKQFDVAPSGSPQLFDAPIDSPVGTQGFAFGLGWKGCTDNNGGYVYIDKAGKRLTRFTATAPYYDKSSGDIFENLTAICSDPETVGDIFAYDNATSTVYRIEASSMTIKTTTELSFQFASTGYVVTDMETTASELYFAYVSIGGTTQKKEDNRTGSKDRNEIGKSETPFGYLYKLSKSALSAVANIEDVSPSFNSVDDQFALNLNTSTYVNTNNLTNYSIDLRLFTKCLFRISSTLMGVYGSVTINGNIGEDTISGSLFIRYQDTPTPAYKDISSDSIVIVSNGQKNQVVNRENIHVFSGGAPNNCVWLSYTGTTLRRGYYNNSGGQNNHGTSTVTLTSPLGTSDPYAFADTTVSTSLVKNAAMVYTGSEYLMLNGDGTLEPSGRFAGTTSGALASSIGTLYLTEEPNGFTQEKTTYYYKFSYLYDGFQESPLSSLDSFISANPGKKIKVAINVPSTVNRRVSHVNLYRSQSGGVGGLAKSFYQLVETISLAPAVAETTLTFGSTSVTGRKFEYVDNFTINQLGPTYESNSGLPETLTTSKVHYGLSCQQGSYHFVADCWHPVLSSADANAVKQYIFRSAQGQFDTFNYFSSFLRLPETPVALVAFKSRIFAFGRNRIWRINPDGFYIEDEMNGFGALSSTSIVTTDFGMFFAGPNGIYVSDGGAPVDISFSINKSFTQETFSSINPSWFDRDKTKKVSLNYDPRNRQLLVAYWPSGATVYNFLVYSIDQKRWDLWSGNDFGATVGAPGVTIEGIPTFWSHGGVVRTVSTATTNKATIYYSPYFDLREPSIQKWLYNIKLQLRDALPTTVTLQLDDEAPIVLTTPTLEEGTALPASGKDAVYRYDIPKVSGSFVSGKRCRVYIASPATCKIDSIDFTYREKIFKGGL